MHSYFQLAFSYLRFWQEHGAKVPLTWLASVSEENVMSTTEATEQSSGDGIR